MSNPFVFNDKVKAVIVSYKASLEFKELLKYLNIEIVETLELYDVDSPVNDHPDMAVHPVNNKDLLVYYKHYDYYVEKLDKYGINVIPSNNELQKNYPNDVLLNVSRAGNYYFHKNGSIDSKLNELLKKDYREVFVNQGYSKCSTMILNENTVVSTDFKLHKKYESLNLKSYLLPAGSIELEGYNTGFIGGTCGSIGKDELIFYGNLEKYKYHNELIKILNCENIKYYYPKTDTFVDRGSVIGILGG